MAEALCQRKILSGYWANNHTNPFFCHWWEVSEEEHEELVGTRE